MKRAVLTLLVTTLALGSAQAQISSAKGSSAISNAVLIEATDMTHSWDPVLSTIIQIPQQKELAFDVALQCGLFTDTLVRSKAGERDTSTAEAAIDVRVKLQKINQDGSYGEPFLAYPDAVTYAKRTQTLMAKFQGIFQQCVTTDPATGECVDYGADTCLEVTPVDNNGDGVIDDYVTTLDEACLDYEEVQLVLDTMNANAFNFVSADLEQGEYRITVEAQITSSTSVQAGSARAKGLVGLGSLLVDEVRFVKGDTGTGM